MRTLSILAICLLMTGISASAQMTYTVKASTAAYTPLTTGTSANGGKIWDADTHYALPLGFSFRMNGVTTQTIYLNGSLLHPTAIAPKHSGSLLLGTGIVDRGTIQGVSKSPVRYSTSGTSGSRIFKLEFANAGFEDEMDKNGALKDSLNMQIWLYEGSNVVEYRFGSAMVSDFSTYFMGKMQSGYVRNLDTNDGSFDKFFYLNGSTSAPTLDSTTVFQFVKGLSTFPANGQVYRFTPKGSSTAVTRVATQSLATVFPTRCTGSIQIRNTSGAMLQAELYSTDGRLVLRSDVQQGDTGIDLSNIAPGQYIIRLLDQAQGLSESQRIEKI